MLLTFRPSQQKPDRRGTAKMVHNLGMGGLFSISPGDPDSILQWLSSYEGGLVPFADEVDPRLVDSPELVGVNCLEFSEAEHTITPDYPSGESSMELTIEFKSTAATQRSGAHDGSNHRFFIGSQGGSWALSHGTATRYEDSATVANNTRYDCLVIGKKLYVNGVEKVDASDTAFSGTSSIPIWLGALNASGVQNSPLGGFISDYKFRQSTKIKVLVLAGQSNCSGRPASYGNLPTALRSDQVSYFAYDTDSTYDGVGDNIKPMAINRWGNEITMISSLVESQGGYYAVIKVSEGGTKLADSWQKGGDEYDRLVAKYNEAITDLESRGFDPEIECFIWNQGESDTRVFSEANEYKDNFLQFWSDIATDTTIPSDTPKIITRIHKDIDYADLIYVDEVRAQQEELAELDGYTLINRDDLSLNADNLHDDSDALMTIGERYADVLTQGGLVAEEWDTVCTIAEGAEDPYDITGNENHLALNSGEWSTKGNIDPDNLERNFTPVVLSDDNGQFVNLGITPTIATRFRVRGYFNSPAISARHGSYTAASACAMGTNTGGSLRAYFGNQNVTVSTDATGILDLEVSVSGFSIGGALSPFPSTPTFGSDAETLWLFDWHRASGTQYPVDGGGYEVQVWESDVLVLDLMPLGAGFVDRVTGNTYLNDGTGSLYAKYIPELLDGSAAADGSTITNIGTSESTCIHNGFEGGHKETDADYTIFEGENLMGNGVDTWNEIYIADYIAHANGTDMVWLQWEEVNGNKVVKERLAYPAGYPMTPAVYLQTLRWSERYTTPPTPALVPAEVTAGTGIGPNGEWADNGAGTVLLVEDA